MGQEPAIKQPSEAPRQPSHAVNQALGLIVFAGGITLLIVVFLWAYHLYESVDAHLFQVQPAATQPVVPGLGAGAKLPPGTLSARPNPNAAMAPVSAVLIIKMVALVVMGWVGALIAGKGVALATGGPARPHREG